MLSMIIHSVITAWFHGFINILKKYQEEMMGTFELHNIASEIENHV